MRTDKLITIIFSVILGIIGLFTIYIMGSSFLYDAGIIGDSDEYVSLKTILEEQEQAKSTEDTDVDEDTLSASPSIPSENENIATQENQQDEAAEVAPPVDIPEESPSISQPSEVKEPVRKPVSNNKVVSPSTPTASTSASAVNKKARYEQLKQKFNYGTDATGAGWFVHEAWDNPGLSRDALICYVSQSGEISLATQYVGAERISHDRAQIQIGRNMMTTSEASANDINYSSAGGDVKERVQYRSGNNKAIVDQIATNLQTNITVTLLGNKEVEFALDNTDKQAIKECKEMAELLSYL